MKIKKLTTVQELNALGSQFWQIIDMPGRDYALSDLAQYLMVHLVDDQAAIWVVTEGDTLVSLILALAPGELFKDVFVLVAYNNPEHPAPWIVMQDLLEAWARHRGARTISMVTHRKPEAWTRKYGFKPIKGTYMKKEITGG